jgi:hypothetical protein
MSPPNILVLPTYAIGLTVQALNVGIAEVLQVNSSTTNYSVGDTVFYKQDQIFTLVSFDEKGNTSRYNMINENSILFKQ